jgi:hypothetical protein
LSSFSSLEKLLHLRGALVERQFGTHEDISPDNLASLLALAGCSSVQHFSRDAVPWASCISTKEQLPPCTELGYLPASFLLGLTSLKPGFQITHSQETAVPSGDSGRSAQSRNIVCLGSRATWPMCQHTKLFVSHTHTHTLSSQLWLHRCE